MTIQAWNLELVRDALQMLCQLQRSVSNRSPSAAFWKFNYKDSLAGQFLIYIDGNIREHLEALVAKNAGCSFLIKKRIAS